MKPEAKSLRMGAAVIAIAALLRLFSGGFLEQAAQALMSPEFTSFLLYAGTGKTWEPFTVPKDAHSFTPESAQKEPAQAVFCPDDASYVSLTNHPGYAFDLQSLLQQPLEWDLTGQKPTVLILHSHACESYENTEGYRQTAYYRTDDSRYNMVSVGKYLAECLESKGICVIHDTTLHDQASYNNAYSHSRSAIAGYLQEYPSIRLVLDIHRDAYEDGQGNQASSTVTVDGVQSARLMIVSGTDAYGENHSGWAENLSLALKLQTTLEKLYPGLCRPLSIRSSAFNQDLSPGALLIEVGTAGDTRSDALAAAGFLADGIAALAYGSK